FRWRCWHRASPSPWRLATEVVLDLPSQPRLAASRSGVGSGRRPELGVAAPLEGRRAARGGWSPRSPALPPSRRANRPRTARYYGAAELSVRGEGGPNRPRGGAPVR